MTTVSELREDEEENMFEYIDNKVTSYIKKNPKKSTLIAAAVGAAIGAAIATSMQKKKNK